MTHGTTTGYRTRRSYSAGRMKTMRMTMMRTTPRPRWAKSTTKSGRSITGSTRRAVSSPSAKCTSMRSEILGPEGKDHWSVRQEVHEATGNEGVSMERWYRQGVIVIWPRDRYFGILAGEGQAGAVPSLEKLAAGPRKPAAAAACRTFAKEIIGHWKPRLESSTCSVRMLKVLEKLGSVDLAQRSSATSSRQTSTVPKAKPSFGCVSVSGWGTFAAELRDFVANQKPADHFAQLENIVSICESLCCDPPRSPKSAARSALPSPLSWRPSFSAGMRGGPTTGIGKKKNEPVLWRASSAFSPRSRRRITWSGSWHTR